MRHLLCAAFISTALVSLAVAAKWTPPPNVPPVTYEGIVYKAPNDNGRVAHIEAYDASTGKRLWKKTVFRNFIWPFLEEDVQWVYIREMKVENNKLAIVDEHGKTYYIHLRRTTPAKRPA